MCSQKKQETIAWKVAGAKSTRQALARTSQAYFDAAISSA